MLFTSINQYAVLALFLVLGLVLGLMLSGGGGKWRRRYEAERDAHAGYRTDNDARFREQDNLGTNRDAYVRDLEKQNAALKDENARLKG